MTRPGIRKYSPIPAIGSTHECPLTFQQQRVLHFCELDPDSSIWDVNTCKRLTGYFNESLMERAVKQLLETHQVLRTSISRGDDGPTQTFDQHTGTAFRHIDMSNEAGDNVEKQLLSRIAEICQKPISRWTYNDLLFEVVLLTLGARDHVVLLRVHHIISDAASVDMLWRDLTLIYNRLLHGAPGSLPPKGIMYSDYAVWQRREFAKEQTREQEQYWLSQFRDEPPAVNLPADSVQSSTISFRGALEIVPVPKELIDKLQRRSWDNNVLLFSTLFAAYFLMLQKICQQEDITVGALFGGRHYCTELNNTAGFFVNTTAVRVNVSWEYTFEQLVKIVHEQLETAYYMQDYPFERLVEKLAPKRGDGRMPLFQTMFNVVSNARDEEPFEGVERERWIDVATQTNAVQVDLIFDIHSGADDAEIRIEHNSEIFRTSTVVRLAKHYITLLRQLCSGWDVGLNEFELVDEQEKRQLIEAWNPVRIPYARDKCVHELFEEQANRTADRIAIVDGNVSITYGEANNRANRVAIALQGLGVRPDSIVAIVGGRSAGMILGQLGILKAGGAYLPIAANTPKKRIHDMLRDAGPRVLILTDEFRQNIEFDGPVLRPSDFDMSGAEEGQPVQSARPSSLAYVMYTSGSTGAPKGVMVEHRSVVNLATNIDYVEIRADDRLLQTGAPAFDATTFEIWGALLNGLRLYVAGDEILLDASALGKFLAKNHITIMFMVPALFHQLVQADVTVFRTLRYLVSGGDVLAITYVDQARKANPSLTVVNGYGPTENTTFSTCYPITQAERRTIPIGKPIANSNVYILDREMMLSPIGAVGELYVGGDGLARGYLNRQGLTKERFIPNPFVPGERIYKTGDLARWRPDGVVEFVGRIDRQVKIRGFRIELGEIENRLLEHAGIEQAAVTSALGQDGNKYLCAYFVAEPSLTIPNVRQHLAVLLPGYMVPSYFCRVPHIPLTSSGKIDQRRLPAPQPFAAAGDKSAALESVTEKGIACIWEELLETSDIGACDNFFEIGGHSLKASVLASRLREEFGVEISLRTVFDSPTIAALAMLVDNGKVERYDDNVA